MLQEIYMTINLMLKSFIAVALAIGFTGIAQAGSEGNTQESGMLAPEATGAEAKASFRDIPLLDKGFVDAAPADRNDGIVTGELGIDGGDKGMIVKLAQEIADGQHGKIDSLLIAHKGKLLFESYYLRGRINLPHPQASASKAYTGFAVGRAIQLGYLTKADLDKPLISFLKDLDPTKFVAGAETITLHKAMTMRSGIRISDAQREELEKTPDLFKGQGLVQAILESSAPITAESQVFLYQDDPMLVMQVIEAVVPGTADDFIKNELFGKIGIADYSWEADVSGLPSAGDGANVTSRDMVKLGKLAKNKGEWDKERLIPADFVDTAINRIIRTSDDEIYGGGADVSNSGYGYYWWQADMKVREKSYATTSASGGGGQFVILVDELDLIIVATGYEREVRTMQMTAERILPAFVQ